VPTENTHGTNGREKEPVDRDQTLEFARALVKEVREAFDSSAVARFYHRMWSAIIAVPARHKNSATRTS
jgi:hypothetical protein